MNIKQILNKISKIEEENLKLFNRKADLEREILAIDIKIFKIMGEYHNYIKELFDK